MEDLDKLRNEINRSKEEVFVKHFSENYEEETPPLWACVHLMTLGELRILMLLTLKIGWLDRLVLPSITLLVVLQLLSLN